MKATREALKDILPTMSITHQDILVLDADIGSATRLVSFSEKFPERFFQIGIAEANMIGIASGLSEHGFKVFLGSFASFISGRYDIIRCSLAYPNRPVVLICSDVGMAIRKDGVTQMGLEDVSIMRALPNMVILNPSTYTEAAHIVKYLCETKLNSPHYLRMGRQPVSDSIATIKNYQFELGKGVRIANGTDITIFSTGCVLPDVIQAKTKIEESIDKTVRIINFHTLKPIDKDIIIKSAQETKYLFSIEDHSVVGGLGSIIADTLSEYYPAKLVKIGLNDEFPESGPPNKLYEKYGLSLNQISQRIISHVNR